jgi:hypothetical protein
MTDERRQRILAAVEAEEAAGRDWTNQSIFRIVEGRYPHVVEVLKALRASRGHEGGVAVAEEPLSPAEALAQTLAEMEGEAEAYRQTLHQLHAKRKARELDVMGLARYFWLEDKITGLTEDIQALAPQLAYRQAEDRAHDGTAQHARFHLAIRDAALRVVQAARDLCTACAQFVALWDEQHSVLAATPGASGQPAFEIAPGSLILQRMLNALRQGGAWATAVLPCLREGGELNNGDSAAVLEQAKSGMEPFAPNEIRRFLDGFAVPVSTPDDEGEDYAQHS